MRVVEDSDIWRAIWEDQEVLGTLFPALAPISVERWRTSTLWPPEVLTGADPARVLGYFRL